MSHKIVGNLIVLLSMTLIVMSYSQFYHNKASGQVKQLTLVIIMFNLIIFFLALTWAHDLNNDGTKCFSV